MQSGPVKAASWEDGDDKLVNYKVHLKREGCTVDL